MRAALVASLLFALDFGSYNELGHMCPNTSPAVPGHVAVPQRRAVLG
jgi:hypothetical protein